MRLISKTILTAVCISLFFVSITIAQTNNQSDVKKRLEMIEQGQAENVRSELPSLLSKYPNDPGVIFLQAKLAEDGQEALRLYQEIVDKYSSSEYADDALYLMYQYYYSIGLYKTADQKLWQLRKYFPNSPFLTDQSQAGMEKKTEPQVEVKNPEPVQTFTEVSKTQTPVQKPKIAKPNKNGSAVKGAFTLQVGAFSDLNRVNKIKSQFEQAGYSVTVVTLDKASGRLYKVWVGEFNTREEAQELKQEVFTKYNLQSIVVSR